MGGGVGGLPRSGSPVSSWPLILVPPPREPTFQPVVPHLSLLKFPLKLVFFTFFNNEFCRVRY